MTEAEKQFLYLFRCHINNEKLPDGYRFDVGRVFSLAAIHNVLPAVYEVAADSCENVSAYRMPAIRFYGNQVLKNSAFRNLYNQATDEGLDLVVLKGPVCAVCYAQYDYRLSSDFDVVVKEEQTEKLHEFFIRHNFQQKNGAYFNQNDGLYIEVSTDLGEGEGAIREMADIAFSGFSERCIAVDGYKTLSFSDNLIYLVYHAFKHFVGSGFGVRQLADIYLFIKKYEKDIDIAYVLKMFSETGLDTFFENVLVCCNVIFGFDSAYFIYNKNASFVCTEEFINDIISAGVFGKSSEDRLHSANLVLNAVANEKRKKGLLKTIFPSYLIMKNRYPVLERFSFLLPFFWILRFFEYAFKIFGRKRKVSPIRSIEIANSRINLMKKMGIIEQ